MSTISPSYRKHFCVRAFSLNPTPPDKKTTAIREKLHDFKGGVAGLKGWLREKGILTERKYGLILDRSRAEKALFSGAAALMNASEESFNASRFHQLVDQTELLKAILDAGALRIDIVAMAKETILLIGQLRKMGHPITVQALLDDEGQFSFVKECSAFGVQVTTPRRTSGGAFWARDQYLKISSQYVYPNHSFLGVDDPTLGSLGEGGTTIELNPPKSFAVHQSVMSDRRVRDYEKKGVAFFPMPDAVMYSPLWADFLQAPTFWSQTHLDMGGFNAIPKRRLLVVNPYYFREHPKVIKDLNLRFSYKMVIIELEEAHVHPENFLILDENTILIDREAPRLAERLNHLGINTVAAQTTLHHVLTAGGKMRCLFNEV